MSYAATKRGKAASKAAREAQRLREEAERRAAEARRRRNRIIAIGASVVVLALVVVVSVVQVRAAAERTRLTGPENMLSDGLLMYGDGESDVPIGLTTERNGPAKDPLPSGDVSIFGIVNVKVYSDYTDPAAAEFWSTNGPDLAERIVEGNVTVELHAIGESAGAVTAAAALACVADHVPDQGLTAHGALLGAGASLDSATDDDVVALLTDAGIDDGKVASCVRKGRYRDWVVGAMQRAADGAVDTEIGPVAGTGVFVLNEPYTGGMGDAAAFTEMLEAALERVSID